MYNMVFLYAFFWVIPRRLNSDAGELPRRKHITFITRRKFEIKNYMVFLNVKTRNTCSNQYTAKVHEAV